MYLLDQILSKKGTTTATKSNKAAKYLFCSTCLHVDETYGNFPYYQQTFEKDNARIEKLFRISRARNMPVLKVNKVPLQVLQWFVDQPNAAAMVLVDNSVLLQNNENRNDADHDADHNNAVPQSQQQSQTPPLQQQQLQSASLSYAGHYMLVIGTSRDAKAMSLAGGGAGGGDGEISRGSSSSSKSNRCSNSKDTFCLVAYNPGQHPCAGGNNGMMYITPSLFERAWRAEGTDEDVIFIVKSSLCSSSLLHL